MLYVDNQSAITFAKHPSFSRESKHIDTKYHFVRERAEFGHLIIKYVSSNNQIADILTKILPRPQFEFLRNHLSLVRLHQTEGM